MGRIVIASIKLFGKSDWREPDRAAGGECPEKYKKNNLKRKSIQVFGMWKVYHLSHRK